ncbi:acyl-CoA carboxylase subunit beta [Chloroflexota bacterium]
MSPEEGKLSPEEEQNIMDMVVERLKLQPEFIESVRKLQAATTMKEALEAFEAERRMILEEAGPEAVEKQHKLGRLTARERVSKLVDKGTFHELDLWHRPYETGFDIGEERGRGDGVVIGYARIGGRPVSLYAQDATIMDGTVATVHARKINMIMDDTLSAKVPMVGIFDSKGLRAHDVIQYPDFFSPGTMAYFQAQASGVLPTIALVMGPCTGDMALVASLSDFVFMVRDTSYMHLASPPEGVTSQELGDPWNVHAKVSGCCDVICDDEQDCLRKCRQLLSFLPLSNAEKPPVADTGDDPNRCDEDLLEIVPTNSKIPYNMYKIISMIVDNGEFFELKRYWASNNIIGFCRFGGKTVGLVASNPQVKAGCMNIDAANKQARFTRFCDAFGIPIVWLVDCPAFLPALEEETRGLIRTACGVIYANGEATVPQITVFLRKIYGGGIFGNTGKFLGGDLQIAWPTYEPGLMGPEGAVSIIYRKELEAIQDPVEKARQTKIRVEEMRWGNILQTREGNQNYIDPRETRPWIISALDWLENRKEETAERKHENHRV